MIGNENVDRLFGESGNDTFVAEGLEAHDLAPGELVVTPPSSESIRNSKLPALDPEITFADANLKAAVSAFLGAPVTHSILGLPIVDSSVHASDLATLTDLDLESWGISDLHGLEYAINLKRLNLLHGQLNHQALHDMLTRLPNRQYFTTSLERIVRHAAPSTGITLYHLDLDAFSMVTGGLGRAVGDQLLKSVADRLKALVAAEEGMVARFDGELHNFANLEAQDALVDTIPRWIDSTVRRP